MLAPWWLRWSPWWCSAAGQVIYVTMFGKWALWVILLVQYHMCLSQHELVLVGHYFVWHIRVLRWIQVKWVLLLELMEISGNFKWSQVGNGTGTPAGTPDATCTLSHMGCPPICTGIYLTGNDRNQQVRVPAGFELSLHTYCDIDS